MKPFPDFSTTKGIRAVADHLEALAADPDLTGFDRRHVIGHLQIRPTTYALTKAAELLRRNQTDRRYSCSAMETDVMKMEAVRFCGSPAAALETIRRQLATQGADMDSADVKRCERAARLIEKAHIAAKAREDALEAENEALLARIKSGTVPDNGDETPVGTPVHVVVCHRSYLATVSGCKRGPHPILGKKYPTMVYTVEATHIRETRGKRYAYFPLARRREFKKLCPLDIRILPELITP